MKTLTITRKMVKELDSAESRQDFFDSVITTLLTDHEVTNARLQEGLNVDLPEPLEGAPGFDSSNMSATQIKIFSMVRAGYFPVHLNCGYSDYRYRHLDAFLDDSMFDDFWETRSLISRKISQSKGKESFLIFLNYMLSVLSWYCRNKNRKDDFS